MLLKCDFYNTLIKTKQCTNVYSKSKKTRVVNSSTKLSDSPTTEALLVGVLLT